MQHVGALDNLSNMAPTWMLQQLQAQAQQIQQLSQGLAANQSVTMQLQRQAQEMSVAAVKRGPGRPRKKRKEVTCANICHNLTLCAPIRTN